MSPINEGGVNTSSYIAIIGLGYVGLPLALAFHAAGIKVVGLEANPDRVSELTAGHSPIDDIDDQRLKSALEAGFIVSRPDEVDLGVADAIIVCVPTPITPSKDPDLGPVVTAARSIALTLRRGQLVVLQSTTYPGTTSGPFRAELERSGLVAGRDFDLAFAPERVNPGDPASTGSAIPRLVGGLTPESTQRARQLFEHISTVVTVSSPDAAEMAKLLENVFRNVNIALVNELALLCERMGLDVWEVTSAAATKPFGFMSFSPGPGVGGHCIPVDPYYLSWRARQFNFFSRFIELAADVNGAMPRHVVDLAADALNTRARALRGARIGIVGVAFKPDVQDARNAPAAEIVALLRERGAVVKYHDPLVATFRAADGVVDRSIALADLLVESDLVIIVTPHRSLDWETIYGQANLVLDTVGSSNGRIPRSQHVFRLGAAEDRLEVD